MREDHVRFVESVEESSHGDHSLSGSVLFLVDDNYAAGLRERVEYVVRCGVCGANVYFEFPRGDVMRDDAGSGIVREFGKAFPASCSETHDLLAVEAVMES